jgi:Leucine-rich repeat (LRR) protein
MLSGNHFIGPIPTEIGLLTLLVEIFLSNNELSSTLPSEIGQLSNLSLLHIRDNEFVGKLPSQWGEQIADLDLHGNSFSGMLPIALTELFHLKFIDASFNNFSGTLPSYFSKFQAVQRLNLGNNMKISGTLPSFESVALNLLDVSNTSITLPMSAAGDGYCSQRHNRTTHCYSCKCWPDYCPSRNGSTS